MAPRKQRTTSGKRSSPYSREELEGFFGNIDKTIESLYGAYCKVKKGIGADVRVMPSKARNPFRDFVMMMTETELKNAYREIAKRCHPDREGGSEAKMALLNTIKDIIWKERGVK